jgi:hypothetical protein
MRRGLQPHRGHGPGAPNRELRVLALRHDFGDLEYRLGSDLPIPRWPGSDASGLRDRVSDLTCHDGRAAAALWFALK